MKQRSGRKKAAGISLILAGLVFIAYLFFGLSMGWSAYFGCAVIAVGGMLLLSCGLFKLFGWRLPDSRIIRVSVLIAKAGLTVFLASFLLVEALIVHSAVYTGSGEADYLLVEGAALHGATPSLELFQRLEKAAEYLEQNSELVVIVSGGQGPRETITEAEAMKRHLVGKGIPEERIIKEDRSTSTYENLKFSGELIRRADKRQDIKLAIVTSDFHIFRSRFLARRLGFTATGVPAGTPLYIAPNHYVREYFAVVKSLAVDRP